MKPDEFWRLSPGEFGLVVDGVLLEREYQEERQAKVLYLLRIPAALAMAQSTGKPVELVDIMHIPEIDLPMKDIIRQREERKENQQRKDLEVFEKYKALEGK